MLLLVILNILMSAAHAAICVRKDGSVSQISVGFAVLNGLLALMCIHALPA